MYFYLINLEDLLTTFHQTLSYISQKRLNKKNRQFRYVFNLNAFQTEYLLVNNKIKITISSYFSIVTKLS